LSFVSSHFGEIHNAIADFPEKIIATELARFLLSKKSTAPNGGRMARLPVELSRYERGLACSFFCDLIGLIHSDAGGSIGRISSFDTHTGTLCVCVFCQFSAFCGDSLKRGRCGFGLVLQRS
jgi:hypothetical protein